MKFSIDWLKQHLDTEASLTQIVEKLNAIGLEVEAVSDPGETLGEFHIAHVVEAKQHPNADKLKVCMVDTGNEMVQVVCGAPNAKTGMKGVFAASGTHIPGTGVDLRPTEIRGVTSHGMLCSERELMISDEHDGIIELDGDAPVGQRYIDYAGLDDPVVEIAITPNRQDCLGVHGIARDLAAAGLGTLKPVDKSPVKGSFDSSQKVQLDFDEAHKDACPVFVGRMIRGLKNRPSPKWLQQRLMAIGLRPISALVDITNFMTFNFGRPLHVYDVAKIDGPICARMGKKGEKFLGLDGGDYVIEGGECVIADNAGVLGFGGVLGGEASGCSGETTDVFLECALFDPVRTAMTGRRHQILSDARFRFERGVDWGFIMDGMEIASRMILDLCGGEASHVIVAGTIPEWSRTVPFDPGRIATLGGLELSEKDSLAILESLFFKPKGKDTAYKKDGAYKIAVPSWRVDVEGEADLVEEVLRIHGYDNIPAVGLPKTAGVAKPTLTTGQKRARAVKRRLASEGLCECITWSFMPRHAARIFGAGEAPVLLDNPISSELDAMRPSILPNLIAAAQRNADRGAGAIALFEVGPQYRGEQPDDQSLVAAGVRAGSKVPRHWAGGGGAASAYDAKADAIAALEAAGAPVANLKVFGEAPSWYHPGRSGTLRLNPKQILASFGEIHPRALDALDADGPMAGFEIHLDVLTPPRSRKNKTKPAMKTSDLQPVERDFAFVVEAGVKASDVIQAARSADKKRITNVGLFDVFAGKGMEPGTKSLAISVRIEPQTRTFTDEEIEAISAKIINAVEKSTGAYLRK
jgi:phenylalanyl-tRNA synthetase beta chain